MSLSSLALSVAWRDYYGMWSAFVEPLLAPLELSTCLAPRIAVLPQRGQNTFGPTGKMQYAFHLVPGSLIWGFWTDGDSNVTIQLTDVALGYQFFQEPLSVDNVFAQDVTEGDFPPQMLLPTPHPVVGDGLFLFEAWGTPGTVFTMLLGVAEVTNCPVR